MWRPMRTGNYRNATLNGRLEAQSLRLPNTVTTRTTNVLELKINDNAMPASNGTEERNEAQILITDNILTTNKGVAVGIRLAEKPDVSQMIQTHIRFTSYGQQTNTSYTAYLGVLQPKARTATEYLCTKYVQLPLKISNYGHDHTGSSESMIILRQDEAIANVEESPGLALILLIYNHHTASTTINHQIDLSIHRYERDIITHDPNR